MRAIKITEADGLFTVETSAGVRSSGASLLSALDRFLLLADNETAGNSTNPLFDMPQAVRWAALSHVFNTIRDSGGVGIVRQGQAAG